MIPFQAGEEYRDKARPTEVAHRGCEPKPGWRKLGRRSDDRSIDATTQRAVGLQQRERRQVWWRLQFWFWRGLEAVVRWIVLDRALRRELRRSAMSRRPSDTGCEFSRRQLSVGHGCPGPDLLVNSVESIEPAPSREPERRIEACVVGNDGAATDLIRCLVSLGANVHATAETVDEYAFVRSAGAMPHRFEDLPAVAARLDLLISTSPSWFVGARVVARLPESATIVDIAGPPGSVDFETSRRLGREVIWERNFVASPSAESFAGIWNDVRARQSRWAEELSVRSRRLSEAKPN